jgi:hypothetical protein
MSIWFSKNLGDAMLAYLVLGNVEAACMSAYKKANSPDDMAVFYRHESEGRLQCEVKVYFSPAIGDTAKKLGASPCEQPTKYGLSLLVGNPAAWTILFPKG